MKKESELAHDWDGVEVHSVRVLRREIRNALNTKEPFRVVREISDMMEQANNEKPDDAAYEIAMLSLRFVRSVYHYNSLRRVKQRGEYHPKLKEYAQRVFDKIDELKILDEELRWKRTEYE